LEEALNLSSDRILNDEWIGNFSRKAEWRSEGHCACAQADGDHTSQSVVTVLFNMDFVVCIFVIVKIFSYRFDTEI
jgi:hypothetical protein